MIYCFKSFLKVFTIMHLLRLEAGTDYSNYPMRQGCSTIENLQPITLLNCDYKTLAHIFANRLKEGLNQIIS